VKKIIGRIINFVAPPAKTAARRRGPGRPAGARGHTQETLLDAARRLMAEKGMPRVTVREVAERAGVQPALVHYYFGGKDGLLRAVVADVSGRMLAAIQAGAATEGSVEERFRALLRAAVRFWAREPYAPRLVMEQVLFGEEARIDEFVQGYARPNLATVSALLEAGARQGEVRPIEPIFLLPSLLGGVIFFFLASPVILKLFELDAITPELAEKLADHTVDVVFHGISPRPLEAS
jgi:AcrR family transcriptional regulator